MHTQVTEAAAGTRRPTGAYNWSSSSLSLYGTQIFSGPTLHWYDTVTLSSFLRDSCVLDALLGVPTAISGAKTVPPVHVQTLSRVPSILRFLAQVNLTCIQQLLQESLNVVMPVLQHGGQPAGNPFAESTVVPGYAGCVAERHVDALFSLVVNQV